MVNTMPKPGSAHVYPEFSNLQQSHITQMTYIRNFTMPVIIRDEDVTLTVIEMVHHYMCSEVS